VAKSAGFDIHSDMSHMDIEKAIKDPVVQDTDSRSASAVVGTVSNTDDDTEKSKFAAKLQKWVAWTGAEQRGAAPVPVEQRTQTNYISLMTVFLTPMTSLLP
jgi:hypothetical protein